MADPIFLVDRVWSWRKFRKVFRFSYWDVDTNKNVVFYSEFMYNNGKDIRYRFWLPWVSEAQSKEIYKGSATYQKVLRHFIAESLTEFVKGQPNG